jgi:hypothetical protein
MRRVCKLGGLVACREADWAVMIHPDPSGLQTKFWDLSGQSITSVRFPREKHLADSGSSSTGSDIFIGRKLRALAIQAGYTVDQLESSGALLAYFAPEGSAFWAESTASRCRDGSIRDWALKNGKATEAELEQMAQAALEWGTKEDATWAMPAMTLLARKGN